MDHFHIISVLDWVRGFLLENPLARLFLIVALGYALGDVNWGGRFRLGVAAVLFVGLGFGMWDPRFEFQPMIASLGLALFVYCVGLEAGPGFFQNFKSQGLKAIVALIIGLAAAFGVCYGFALCFKIDRMIWPGLFCGALTSTPALAAATESLRDLGESTRVNRLVQGFGIAYPISVITLLAYLEFLMQWRKSKSTAEKSPNFIYPAKTLQILNLPSGYPEWTPEILEREFFVKVTRYQTMSGRVVLVTDLRMSLDVGSYFVTVGTPEHIGAAADAVGRVAGVDLVEEMHGFELHRYHVSNVEVVGKPIQDLNLERAGAIITRLRRGDIDLEVTPETLLQLGDRIRVLSLKETEHEVRKLFGNSMIVLSENGYASFGLGIVLGVLVGMIPFTFPGASESFKLGSAGGCLIVGLLLGAQGRTGKVVWLIPQSNNMALRQLGILFFLACIGVQAGGGFLQVIKTAGLSLMLPVVSITLIAHGVLCFVLRRFGFRSPEMWVGSCCGLHTQPAALAFASQRMDRAPVALAYATVFPMALLIKVIMAQLLVRIFY
ncbi:MAG: TrkA C-terminal domain-containing protein [Verrucomicrobiota bacterium]